jgi:hypothetical protein
MQVFRLFQSYIAVTSHLYAYFLTKFISFIDVWDFNRIFYVPYKTS